MVSGRTTGLFAEQCTAKAKGTQQRCQRLVMGGGVCIVHGGRAPQVNAAREARVVAALAQMSSGVTEARDPGEALVSAAVDADAIVQRLKSSMDAGEEFRPGELRALGDWLDRVARISKTVIDARVDERKVRVTELQHRQFTEILKAVLVALGHDPDDPEVIEVVQSCSAAIGAGRRPGLAAVVIAPERPAEVSRAVSRAKIVAAIEPVSCSAPSATQCDTQSPSTTENRA
jgi:hypothetical protein